VIGLHEGTPHLLSVRSGWKRDRFARRDSAFVKRQIRMDNLDAFLSQWKDMYDGTS
jgi:hypothetical protein